MNNLPLHQKSAIEAMPEQAKRFIVAKFSEVKASELPINQMEAEIAKLITNILADAGFKSSTDDSVIIHLSTRLSEDARSRYKHLTLSEIKMALNSGVRGDYGQFMGINVTTINNWIKAFETCELRKMAMIDYNTRLSAPTQKPEPTPEEIENILKTACNKAYEDFKKDGSLPYSCGAIYDYFKKNKGIVWTKEERAQIEKEAEVAYKGKLKEKGKAEFSENGLKAEKKRVALKFYFNKLLKKS